jgi:hypothetical protein
LVVEIRAIDTREINQGKRVFRATDLAVPTPKRGIMEHEITLATAANDNDLAGQSKFATEVRAVDNYQFDHPYSYE